MSTQELQTLITPLFDETILLKIVKNSFTLDKIILKAIEIPPSSQKIGDSYLSNIVRFTIQASGVNTRGENESVTLHVITKIIPTNKGRKLTFRSYDFFENEIIFYDKVWAAMNQFYTSKSVGGAFGEFIPRLLAYSLDDNHGYICLEDLSYQGYKPMERGDGVNRFYTLKAMDLFAKFHSISLAFKDQQPEKFTEIAGSLKETYFTKKLFTWYGKLQETLKYLILDAVKKELPSKYFDKINAVFKEDFYNKVCDICQNHSKLSGITEGDAWIPNFLFQEKDNEVNVVLIDFQLARWAPFCNDIIFFFLTCVEQNTLSECWDDFLSEYSSRMKNYLGLLGSSPDIFNIDDFKKEIKDNIVFGIAMAIEALPMSLIDGFDLELIKGDEAVPLESVWIMQPFQDKLRRQKVSNMIKLIVDKELI